MNPGEFLDCGVGHLRRITEVVVTSVAVEPDGWIRENNYPGGAVAPEILDAINARSAEWNGGVVPVPSGPHNCGNCWFGIGGGTTGDIVECHRRAPMGREWNHGPSGFLDDNSVLLVEGPGWWEPIWPPSRYEYWCGEWRARG